MKKRYKERLGQPGRDLTGIFDLLPDLNNQNGAVFHASGFDHPNLPVITSSAPNHVQMFGWGLIPSWTQDSVAAISISNKTLNARGEEMFDKPSFREAAAHRRCLIVADGFYEHHHLKGKVIPYHIELKDDAPMIFAGIWEHWQDVSSGVSRDTVSIVTTSANPLMARIHNNPKLAAPRMPLILDHESELVWLDENITTPTELSSVIRPFDEHKMKAHTVSKLRGREYLGNVPEITEEKKYAEMYETGSLF